MWEFENVGMWDCGNGEMWECENVGMWECGNDIWVKNKVIIIDDVFSFSHFHVSAIEIQH